VYGIQRTNDPADAKDIRSHEKLVRPEQQTISLYGVTLTNHRLQKFIQLQLLVQTFYLSLFLCTYLGMYIDGRLPMFALVAPLVTLLLNLLVVTPCTMFLGFG
jgi:hypothetical protein